MKQLLIGVLLCVLAGCVQSPTKNTQVVDDRPGLAFDLPSSSSARYELLVDGVSYGVVGQYQAGDSMLKLIDGTHQIELVDGGKTMFSQTIYLGAGVNRIVKVRP